MRIVPFLCLGLFLSMVWGDIEHTVEMLELKGEDTGSLQERIRRLQSIVEKQEMEIQRLRDLILSPDCNTPSIGDDIPSIIQVPSSQSDEEINIVWTVDELEADGLSASLHSVLTHTLPSGKRKVHVHLLVEKALFHVIPLWLFPQIHQIYGSGEYNGTASLKTWPFHVTMKEYHPGNHYENAEQWIVHGSHLSHLDKEISFARLFLKDYFPNLGKTFFIQNDVIVSRDLNDIWDVALKGPSSKVIAAFRDCKMGYRHYFDISHAKFVEADFRGCRCVFSDAIMVLDLDLWQKKRVNEVIQSWLQDNMKEPLYFGAAQAPLLAAFYGKYENLASTWNHTHSLGKNRNINKKLLEKSHSMDWSGKNKPWLLSGHTYSALWKKYSLSSPSYRNFKFQHSKKRQETLLSSEKYLLAKMRETWVDDEYETNGGEDVSQSGSLLVLVIMLSIFMVIVLAWLHLHSPKQHQYEKTQIRKLNAKLHQTKIVKRISYVME